MPPKRKNPPPRKLTQRQLNFCQYIVDGLPQYEAYIKAGYSDGKQARTNSSRLMSKDGVQRTVSQLRSKIDAPRLLTRELIRQKRAEIALGKGSTSKDVLAAMRDDSKMMGWDAPQVVEIRGSLIDQLRGG